MTAADDLMDEAIRLSLILDQLAQHSFGVVLDRLTALSHELAILVIRIDPTAVVRDSSRRARLEALVEEIDKAIEAAYRDIGNRVNADLDDAATLSQDSLSTLLAALLLIKGLSRALDKPALTLVRKETTIIGASVMEWWQRQAEDLKFRTRRVLEDALRLTQVGKEPGTGDLVGVIKDTAPGSLFSAPPRHAEGLIRSTYHAVANFVRFEVTQRHPELFRAYMHLSIIDSRTTVVCRKRSNRLWSLEGMPIGHTLPFARPPLHWLCRSHIVPVMHAFDDMPPSLKRRLAKDYFDGKAKPEPDLKDWLAARGEQRDPGPLDYQAARTLLGL